MADDDRETAPAVIQSGALSVKQTTPRPPRVFGAKPGAVSGTVDLVARSAGHRAAYEWESSSDTGKTWAVGEDDWSQPVSIIVRWAVFPETTSREQ